MRKHQTRDEGSSQEDDRDRTVGQQICSIVRALISTASFYTEEVGVDDHDDGKVIDLQTDRDEYVKHYKAGEINLETHPIMKQHNNPECDSSTYAEMAKVAAVSCMHITRSCGGNPLTGEGCRFDFPKKKS